MSLLAIAIGVVVFVALLHFGPDPNKRLKERR